MAHAVGADEDPEVPAPGGEGEGVDGVGIGHRGHVEGVLDRGGVLVETDQLSGLLEWKYGPQLAVRISGELRLTGEAAHRGHGPRGGVHPGQLVVVGDVQGVPPGGVGVGGEAHAEGAEAAAAVGRLGALEGVEIDRIDRVVGVADIGEAIAGHGHRGGAPGEQAAVELAQEVEGESLRVKQVERVVGPIDHVDEIRGGVAVVCRRRLVLDRGLLCGRLVCRRLLGGRRALGILGVLRSLVLGVREGARVQRVQTRQVACTALQSGLHAPHQPQRHDRNSVHEPSCLLGSGVNLPEI